MTKKCILIVDDCYECPHFILDDEEHFDFCELTHEYVEHMIPLNCPLPAEE